MQRAASLASIERVSDGGHVFEVATFGVILASAALAGWMPLGFSIVTVFLFAGPHNWLEARYMLSRMPGKWGPLRSYFLVGLVGVPILAAGSAAMPLWLNAINADAETWMLSATAWNVTFVVWVLLLIHMRSRQKPVRDWSWTVPAGLAIAAASAMWPFAWSLLLVYAHPLLALWFLDREIMQQRPEWLPRYQRALLIVPGLLGMIWWNLMSAPNLPGDDIVSTQIAHHAGGGLLQGVSTHALVSTHVFLEMLHYGVWVLAMPLIGIRRSPITLDGVPLAKRSRRWRFAIVGVLAIGVAVTMALWAGFVADYSLTRDIYFTIAILHVLAEVPFLLRLL